MEKKNKKKKKIDLDVRPEGPWYSNYDYGGPEKPNKTGPGRGLFAGPMDRFKSIKDFLNKKRKKKASIDELLLLTDRFEHLVAQEISVDSSLVDLVKKQFGPPVFKEAEKLLNEKAISSIPVRVVVQGKKATFVADSTGTDKAEVDEILNKVLNQRYGSALSQTIMRALKGQEANLNFGLTTVESAER